MLLVSHQFNPTLPPVVFALWCPCGVAWDAVPKLLLLVKLLKTVSLSSNMIQCVPPLCLMCA